MGSRTILWAFFFALGWRFAPWPLHAENLDESEDKQEKSGQANKEKFDLIEREMAEKIRQSPPTFRIAGSMLKASVNWSLSQPFNQKRDAKPGDVSPCLSVYSTALAPLGNQRIQID